MRGLRGSGRTWSTSDINSIKYHKSSIKYQHQISVFEFFLEPVETQQILHLAHPLAQLVELALDVLAVAVQRLAALMQRLEFQQVRPLFYPYRFLQSLYFLAQLHLQRLDSPFVQLFFNKIQLKLQILHRSKGTLASTLAPLHYYSKAVS